MRQGATAGSGERINECRTENGTSKLTNMTVTAALKSDGDYTNDDFTAVTSNKVDATLSYASFDAIKAACDWMKGNWIK